MNTRSKKKRQSLDFLDPFDEMSKKLLAWNLSIEQTLRQFTENISLIVARQERARSRAVNIHEVIDAEADKVMHQITVARQTAHETIDERLTSEIVSLQCYLDDLEISVEICSEETEKLSAAFNQLSGIDSSLAKMTDILTHSQHQVKDHINTLQKTRSSLHKKTAVGPVTVNKTRCDELQAFLSKGELFAVSNKIAWGGQVPRSEDATVMLMNIFERHGICEECVESGIIDGDTRTGTDTGTDTDLGETKSVRPRCVSCGGRLRVNGHLNQPVTIKRKAGFIESATGIDFTPQGLTLLSTDTDKFLFVSNSNNDNILVMDSQSGQHLRSLKIDGRYLTTLVRSDIMSNLLIVGDWNYDCVKIIDVSHGDVVLGTIDICRPMGLAVLETQVSDATVYLLFVSSYHSGAVLVFDVNTMEQVNRTEKGQLLGPRGLALLPSSMSDMPESILFVCDDGKHNIQIFDAMSGISISTIGSGVLQSPWGATLSSSLDYTNHTLIISDFHLHKLFLFDAITGDSVRSIGSQGSAINQFYCPRDVTAIRDDNDHIIIYTADNNRVQVSVVQSRGMT